jgi:hypothetical protein
MAQTQGGGEYVRCPACKNKRVGTKIYQCHSCGCIFCDACAQRGWRRGFREEERDFCPECNEVVRLSESGLGEITP